MNKKKYFRTMLVVLLFLICIGFNAHPAFATTNIKFGYSKDCIKGGENTIILYKNKKTKLSVKGTRERVNWKSSKKNVATVSNTGVVEAKKRGIATISATIKGKTVKCKVVIKDCGLNVTSKKIKKGSSFTLKMINKKGKITWSSSNKKVASVTQAGKVKALKNGTTIITAKMKGKKYTCKVVVSGTRLYAYACYTSIASIKKENNKLRVWARDWIGSEYGEADLLKSAGYIVRDKDSAKEFLELELDPNCLFTTSICTNVDKIYSKITFEKCVEALKESNAGEFEALLIIVVKNNKVVRVDISYS